MRFYMRIIPSIFQNIHGKIAAVGTLFSNISTSMEKYE